MIATALSRSHRTDIAGDFTVKFFRSRTIRSTVLKLWTESRIPPSTLYRLPSSSAVDLFLSLHPAAAAAPDRRYRGHSVPPISSYYSLLTQRAPCFNKSIRSAPRPPHPRTDTAYDSPPGCTCTLHKTALGWLNRSSASTLTSKFEGSIQLNRNKFAVEHRTIWN